MTGPLLVTEVLPATLSRADLARPEGRKWLDRRYASPRSRFVRLNMITTLTGAAAGADGTSDSLTNLVDRAVMGAVRRAADVVVVGAQSVRAEGYVVPRTAALAIVTRTGDLRGHQLVRDAAAAGRVLLLCPAERAAQVTARSAALRAPVVPVASDGRDLSPAAIIDALATRGLSRIVCEGGPSLASQFAAAGVLDELCLTVAPVVGAASEPFLRVDVSAGLDTTVSAMLVDAAGFSYLRLRVRPRVPAA